MHNEFVAWDGEGITYPDNPQQKYVLFGNSQGFKISNRDGLHTTEILDFILDVNKRLGKTAIHVAFAFNYDVDMILRDVPDELLKELWDSGECIYERFHITWIPRKMFTISKRGKGKVTIQDTFTFFAKSLIGACKEYIPNDPLIDIVEQGKNLRNEFSTESWDTMELYFDHEGQLMVSLLNALRESMLGAGIKLGKNWHGPGAVAGAIIKKQRIAKHIRVSRDEMPEPVLDATSYAYFGGRFENYKIGIINTPIYSYDLRSAYPAALASMPGLVDGEWVHEYEPSMNAEDINEYGLYHVTWDLVGSNPSPNVMFKFGPFPVRMKGDLVSYPFKGAGWYYGHEIKAARLNNIPLQAMELWYYKTQKEYFPFAFLSEMYYERLIMKERKDPAQLAQKLGMNSIYGKLAQRVGWDETNKQPPKYHHQWYAGLTTSWCRARILDLMLKNHDDIISVETDGLYSLKPLQVADKPLLGYWESNKYDSGAFIQSGMYLLSKDKEWTVKSRGVEKKAHQSLIDQIFEYDLSKKIETTTTRYCGIPMHIGKETRHTWKQDRRTMQWGGAGKRHHTPFCPACVGNADIHLTTVTTPITGHSLPRALPWRDQIVTKWDDTDDMYMVE